MESSLVRQDGDPNVPADLLAKSANMELSIQARDKCETDLSTVERIADKKLLVCHRLSTAISAVVDDLSQAGSLLQRTMSCAALDGLGVGALLEDDDPIVSSTVRSMFEACGDVSVALVDLAVSLAGEVQKPLEDLQRAVRADRTGRAAELDELRRRHQACAGAVTESLRQKDKLSAQLQTLIADSEGASTRSRFWKRSGGSEDTQSRVKDIMAQQAAAVEDLAMRMEQTIEVSDAAQSGSEDLCEVLRYVDYAMKWTLQSSLGRFAVAWDAIASCFQATATQLHSDALQVRPLAPCGLSAARAPGWAAGARGPTEEAGASLSEAAARTVAASEGGRSPSAAGAPERDEAEALTAGWAQLEARQLAWQHKQDTREIRLLEKEENLHKMQAELDTQHQLIGEHRRSLALDQARCLAQLEECASLPSPEQDRRRLSGRRLTAEFAISEDTPTPAGDEDHAIESEQEEATLADEDDVAGDVDIWNMDWTNITPSRRSPGSPSCYTTQVVDESHDEHSTSRGTCGTGHDVDHAVDQKRPSLEMDEVASSGTVPRDGRSRSPSQGAVMEEQVSLYLPFFVGGKRVLAESEVGKFVVDNSEVQSKGKGLHYRCSKNMEDRHTSDFASWGTIVQGTVTDGWLKVVHEAPVEGATPMSATSSRLSRAFALQQTNTPPVGEADTSQMTPDELDALREKMHEKRELADRHNGEARMPGAHPEIAEKLEARRRWLDQQEALPAPDPIGEEEEFEEF